MVTGFDPAEAKSVREVLATCGIDVLDVVADKAMLVTGSPQALESARAKLQQLRFAPEREYRLPG